jgi:hypothetical protein
MLRLRIVVVLCAALLLSLAVPRAALAEDPDLISGVTIGAATVDPQTGVATVTFSVTCLVDIPFPGGVRGEATLTQSRGSGHRAFSSLGGFGGSTCQAGQVLTFPVRFPPFIDRFLSGPAEIRGFMEALCCFSGDTETIGPATVVLRPA